MMARSVSKTLATVAKAGYKEVELRGSSQQRVRVHASSRRNDRDTKSFFARGSAQRRNGSGHLLDAAGKLNPLTWLAKYPGRFHLLHLKDMGAPPKTQMLDVGKGVIDWRGLLPHSKAAGVKHFLVENEQTNESAAGIRSSYHYLKALRF